MFHPPGFKDNQLKYDRVKDAYDTKERTVKSYFEKQNLDYDGFQLFIRGFKQEELVEVWVKAKDKQTYSLLTTYRFCASSGNLGPKRKEGDRQIPEGIYHLNHFNPLSNFHLSLGINYPNASDKILGDKQHPGSAIYIHGNCVTVGCIPITDDKIKELYVLAVEARNNGQTSIPIHIFPAKLDQQGIQSLQNKYSSSPELIHFWENLKTIFEDFEKNGTLKSVKVNNKDEYFF